MNKKIWVFIPKKIIWTIAAIDSALRRGAQSIFRPAWKRAGKCIQCGTCCKLIGLEMENKLAGVINITAKQQNQTAS